MPNRRSDKAGIDPQTHQHVDRRFLHSAYSPYDEIIEKLISRGIPRDQIAAVGDADSDAKKQVLFEKVRNDAVRILIGSTQKMGTGTNVQKRLAALHHLDAPWKPAEVEQRDGRILRQGNENKEIEIFRYVTEGSFDAYMWQALETSVTGNDHAILVINRQAHRLISSSKIDGCHTCAVKCCIQSSTFRQAHSREIPVGPIRSQIGITANDDAIEAVDCHASHEIIGSGRQANCLQASEEKAAVETSIGIQSGHGAGTAGRTGDNNPPLGISLDAPGNISARIKNCQGKIDASFSPVSKSCVQRAIGVVSGQHHIRLVVDRIGLIFIPDDDKFPVSLIDGQVSGEIIPGFLKSQITDYFAVRTETRIKITGGDRQQLACLQLLANTRQI